MKGFVPGFLAFVRIDMTPESAVQAQVIVLATATIFTVLSTVMLLVFLRRMRKARSAIGRVCAAVLVTIALLSSPGLLDIAVTRMNHTSGAARVMIDPGWPVKLAPAMLAIIMATILSWRRNKHARK